MRPYLIAIILLLAPLGACSQEGELRIALDVAEGASAQNPFSSEAIRRLTVTIERGGLPAETLTTEVTSSGAASLGNVDVGDYSRIVVRGSTADGVLVAYGSANEGGSISATDPKSVSIPFRYPLIYMGGAPSLYMFHPFLTLSNTGFPPMPIGETSETTTAVAISPDGQTLLVATFEENPTPAARLYAYRTKDHKKLVNSLIPTFAVPVERIRFSPSGNTAALYSAESPHLYVMNVERYLATVGDVAAFTRTPLDNVVQVDFASDSELMVLQSERWFYNTCDSPPLSTLSRIEIPANLDGGTNLEVNLSIELQNYTTSIAAVPDQGLLYLAQPCAQRLAVNVVGLEQINTALSPTKLAPCSTPLQLLAGKEYLHATCATEFDASASPRIPTQLLIQRLKLYPTGSEETALVHLAYPNESLIIPGTFPEGTYLQLIQEPSRVLPIDISLAVEGEQIAILAEAYYESPQLLLDDAVISPILRKSLSLILLDPNTPSITRRLRAACYEVSGPLDQTLPASGLSGGVCGPLDNVDEPDQEFIPISLSAVYGQ